MPTGPAAQADSAVAEAVPAGAALCRGWAELVSRVDERLHAAVDAALGETIAAAARTLESLVDGDPDLAIAHVVRIHPPGRPDGDAVARYAARHAVNAATAALLAARRLGWDAGTRATLARAALTMNLAMADLQNRLALQTSPLTELQRQAIRSHPQRSAELLRAGGVDDAGWADAVARHHERADRSGYPHGLGDVGRVALMLGLVDDFTAKFAARALRPALTADKAVRQFHHAHAADPLAEAIVAEFGVYPPGCAVRLHSGEIGVVMRRGAAPAAPLVVAVRAPSGDALPEPQRRDTTRPENAVATAVSAAAVRVRLPLERLLAARDA